MDANLRQHANQIWMQIASIKDYASRRDLEKMFHSVDQLLTELSKEMVECRRLKRITPKYADLASVIQDRLNTIEQYVTLAILCG